VLGVLALLFGALAYLTRGDGVAFVASLVGAGVVVAFALVLFEPMVRRIRDGQDEVRESGLHMRAVLDAASEGILSLDSEGKIETINPAAERMFLYRPHEAVESGVHLLIDELDIRAERNSGARTGTRPAIGRRSDGSEFPVEIGLATTRIEGREVHILTVMDGSVQARAEQAIAESEMRRLAILDAACDPIVSIDVDGKITEFNPAAERTFGWESRQVVGKEFADVLIPHPRRMAIRRGLREAAQSGTGALLDNNIELAARRKDGREVQVEMKLARVELASGRQFTARLRDVTELNHNGTDQTRTFEDDGGRSRAIVEAAASAILTIDESGRIETMNAAGERLFGWSAKELAGADVVRLIPADQGEARESLFERARIETRLGYGAVADLAGVRRDGTRFPMHVSASRVRVGDRGVYTWVVRDLTVAAEPTHLNGVDFKLDL
jgi:PAS domain S-box-containing protein